MDHCIVGPTGGGDCQPLTHSLSAEEALPVYRVYTFDPAGRFQQLHLFDCAGDDTAIRHAQQHARQLQGRHKIELWDGERLVALIAPDEMRSRKIG
jgi:hypothetical protein